MKSFTLLFLLRDNQILLAMKKRGFGSGLWNGVGGKIEAAETIEQALVRECQEEIGVTPKSYDQVASHDFLFPNGKDLRVHTFVCCDWQGEPTESEEMRPEWFELDNIPYDLMWQDDILWLPSVLAGRQLHCNFSFDERNKLCSANIRFVSIPGAK